MPVPGHPGDPGESRRDHATRGAPTAAGGTWSELASGAAALVRRQLAGGYHADEESGFDPEFNSGILMPAARLLYRSWFRVKMRGIEHVPAAGPALVVANHSGVLPLDAIMLQVGVHDEHPARRNLRLLGADMVYSVPGLGTLARKSGHVRANPANAERLLAAGELVGVFPEGFKGIGKPFAERYRLQRFGRGGFAATAMRADVPIIPCAIVGAEEIYPMVADWTALAKTLGLPYFPVTPLFPWLGPLGMIPLPSNWIIEFCAPVPVLTGARRRPADAVTSLADQVKAVIAGKLDELLAARGPAFGDLPDGGLATRACAGASR